MQLLDTNVGNPNDGLITVDFEGEGGERVSVRMAAADLQGEAAIHRAKAMMVQLATFDRDRDRLQDD